MNIDNDTALDSTNETINNPQPKRKKIDGKHIFIAVLVVLFGCTLIYKTVFARTVDRGDGWKHQVGYFGECDFADRYHCGKATHRVVSSFVTAGKYCDEHWESYGVNIFERLAKKSISGSSSSKSPERDAKICAKMAVEDQLKAPSTADFCSTSEMDAQYLGDDRWKITGYVDAENSFGTKLRQNWTVTLTLTASGFTDYSVTLD